MKMYNICNIIKIIESFLNRVSFGSKRLAFGFMTFYFSLEVSMVLCLLYLQEKCDEDVKKKDKG